MRWQQVRKRFPSQWVLIEALKARSFRSKRHVDDMAVVGAFSDSQEALREYGAFHHETPARELYVFHTARARLDVGERVWTGIRGQK